MCIKVGKKMQVPFVCPLYRCNSNSVSPNTYLTKQCNLPLSFLFNITINNSNNIINFLSETTKTTKNIESKNIFPPSKTHARLPLFFEWHSFASWFDAGFSGQKRLPTMQVVPRDPLGKHGSHLNDSTWISQSLPLSSLSPS